MYCLQRVCRRLFLLCCCCCDSHVIAKLGAAMHLLTESTSRRAAICPPEATRLEQGHAPLCPTFRIEIQRRGSLHAHTMFRYVQQCDHRTPRHRRYSLCDNRSYIVMPVNDRTWIRYASGYALTPDVVENYIVAPACETNTDFTARRAPSLHDL